MGLGRATGPLVLSECEIGGGGEAPFVTYRTRGRAGSLLSTLWPGVAVTPFVRGG